MEPESRAGEGEPTLFLCGAGNAEGVRLALSIARRSGRWSEVVLLDDDPSLHGGAVLGVPVEGPFDLLTGADPGHDRAVNLVARTATGRGVARERIEEFGIPFTPLVGPDVDLFGVDIPEDLIVYPGAHLGAGSAIGKGTVVFMGAMVGHGARVGRCCVLAPGAILNARVELGDRVYVGTNASVLPELSIGKGATIGAGSVVVSGVAEGASVLGVPAETIMRSDAPPRRQEADPCDTDRLDRRSGSSSLTPARPERSRYAAPEPRHEPAPGESAVGRVIEGAWKKLLGNAPSAPGASFFQEGGTSLELVQMVREAREEMGLDLPIRLFLADPSLRGICRAVEEHIIRDAGDDLLEEAMAELHEPRS